LSKEKVYEGGVQVVHRTRAR